MNLLCFDIETTSPDEGGGLQPWRKGGEIRSIAFAKHDENEQVVAKAIASPTIEQINDHIRTADALVGWNLVFDTAWLLAKGVDRDALMRLRYIDGMILWYMVDKLSKMYRKEELRQEWSKGLSYSLKQAVEQYSPDHAGYGDDIDFDNTPIDTLLAYNRLDATLTLSIIASHFIPALSREELVAAMMYSDATPLVADAWQRGILADMTKTNALHKKLQLEITARLGELGLSRTAVKSTKQLQELMFSEWGLHPPVNQRATDRAGMVVPMMTDAGFKRYQETGAWDYTSISTDSLSLVTLADQGEPRAQKIAEVRALMTKQDKFTKGVQESVKYNGDGKVYPTPRLHGTYTGRMTYSSKTLKKLKTGVALHQWQSDPAVRDLLKVPDGYVLAEFDAAGQEMRLMACAAQDPTMIKLFNDGMDLHSYMGAMIAGRDYAEFNSKKETDPATKQQRKLGKLANLSLQYRTSNYTLRDRAREGWDLSLTIEECNHIIDTYHSTYGNIKPYWYDAISEAQRHGYARTFMGRKVELDYSQIHKNNQWRLDSTAINFPIQGTGADMKMLALATLRKFLHDEGVLFAWDLHDGLFFYIPRSAAECTAKEILSRLNGIDYKKAWGWEPLVNMTWDAKIGTSWGTLEEIA